VSSGDYQRVAPHGRRYRCLGVQDSGEHFRDTDLGGISWARSSITCARVGGRDRPGAAVDARGFMGLIYRAEVAWGQSVMTVAAILRRADRVLLVRETRAEIEVWGPQGGVVEPGELLSHPGLARSWGPQPLMYGI
jgi:hypothetical protein